MTGLGASLADLAYVAWTRGRRPEQERWEGDDAERSYIDAIAPERRPCRWLHRHVVETCPEAVVPSPLTPTWIVVRTGLRGTPTPAVADTVGLGEALRLTVRYDEADDYPRVQVAISEQALDDPGQHSAPLLSVPPVGATADLSPGIRLNGRMAVAT